MERVEIWMVRHGETESNAGGLLSGWAEVQLTDCGRRQAEWLRPKLAGQTFERVWSSDLGRAVETARLAHPGDPKVDRRLREIDFGSLEGARYESLAAEHKDSLLGFDGFSAPDGESTAELTDRVTAFLNSLPPGRHLVFTHGGVVRAILRLVGPDRFLANGSLVAIDWTGKNLLFIEENGLGTSSALIEASRRKPGCSD